MLFSPTAPICPPEGDPGGAFRLLAGDVPNRGDEADRGPASEQRRHSLRSRRLIARALGAPHSPMKQLPTDRALLSAIYDRYYAAFSSYSKEESPRSSKIYVPIDVEELAREFRVDPDIIFGRLYYHLNQKYGYSHEDGTKVPFFTLKAGGDRHCVNFPYLASILADLADEHSRYRTATGLAALSLVISAASLVITLMR